MADVQKTTEQHRQWQAFRYPSFRRFWFGNLVSRTGSWMHVAAVPYVLYEVTNKPVWVGAAGGAFLLPQLVAAVPGGILADRMDRLKALRFIHLLILPLAVLLIIVVGSGDINPWLLLCLSALLNGLVGLQMPASQTISSEIVPPKLVGEAVHLNVVAYQAARAIGPLCAGFVLARWGVQWAFAIDAISYLVALMTLLSIRSNSTPSRSGLHTWTFRQTWRMPGVAIGVVATAVIALFGPPIVQLTAVLADVSFKVDASGYGLLLGSYGFGSFAGALVLSLTAHRMRKSRVVTLSAIVFGLSLIALSATDQFAIGLFAIALAGSCFSISLGSLNSGIQTSATHNARGKAVGLYLISLNGAAAVGALAAGWASGHAAVTTVVAVLGSALAFGTILLFSSRRLTALDVVPERGAPVIQQAR